MLKSQILGLTSFLLLTGCSDTLGLQAPTTGLGTEAPTDALTDQETATASAQPSSTATASEGQNTPSPTAINSTSSPTPEATLGSTATLASPSPSGTADGPTAALTHSPTPESSATQSSSTASASESNATTPDPTSPSPNATPTIETATDSPTQTPTLPTPTQTLTASEEPATPTAQTTTSQSPSTPTSEPTTPTFTQAPTASATPTFTEVPTPSQLPATPTVIPTPTATVAPPYIEEWQLLDFEFDAQRSGCTGDGYVRSTNYDVGRYVGVRLCSNSRYKIFLADDLEGPYLDIADRNGNGEDHCEFVSGVYSDIAISEVATGEVRGFARQAWGQEPSNGTFDLNSVTIPQWYECEIDIPGSPSGTPVEYPVLSHWTQIDFDFDSTYVGCSGTQYVKSTGYEVGRYVGVVLCSPEQYKIMLGNSLDDLFYSIGDGAGNGEDHCEFVGGVHQTLGISYQDYNPLTGYGRRVQGESPQLMTLEPDFWIPRWNRCGISIPGNDE